MNWLVNLYEQVRKMFILDVQVRLIDLGIIEDAFGNHLHGVHLVAVHNIPTVPNHRHHCGIPKGGKILTWNSNRMVVMQFGILEGHGYNNPLILYCILYS